MMFFCQEHTTEVDSGSPSNFKLSLGRCHGKSPPRGLKLRLLPQKCKDMSSSCCICCIITVYIFFKFQFGFKRF